MQLAEEGAITTASFAERVLPKARQAALLCLVGAVLAWQPAAAKGL